MDGAIGHRAAIWWVIVAAATAAGSVPMGLIGFPAPALAAGLLVGIAFARLPWRRLLVGARASGAANAVIGASLGVQITAQTLSAVGSQWAPVLLVALATLVFSLAIGVAFQRATGFDAPTAVLGVLPGGSVGVIAMSRELGGDAFLVGFSQYLRVFVILLVTPIVATLAFDEGPGLATSELAPASSGAATWAWAVAVAGAGWLLGRVARLPTASLLGPLVLGSVLAIGVPGLELSVPPGLLEPALAVIGLDVGLRFTRAALVRVRRALVALAVALAELIVVCAALAAALAATTPMSMLDAYLATTPGGLSVVAATAYGTGANTALVVAVQSLRLVIMLALAPAAARLVIERLGGARGSR